MKSTSAKEDITEKKKYVFFSDPDIIAQRVEASAAAAVKEVETRQQSEQKSSELNSKGQTFSYHLVQPYPFTFISAVKRKLASDDTYDTCKKSHDSIRNAHDPTLNADIQLLHEIGQKMDFIKPLKVPDSKISKKLDYSRENSKELIPKDLERTEKSTKNFERVQRRLDFSASDVSSNNSEIEPLKVPNISISSHLSKKKEYVQNSREKENRSKKIRKDDGKQDEAQDIFKRSRSPRHPRKEFSNPELGAKLKSDRLFNMPSESEFGSRPKSKNLATSRNDKKRSLNRSLKSRDTSLDSKNRSYSNESLSSAKLSEKITFRESRNVFENFDYRYKDDLKSDDHAFSLDTRQKQHKPLQNAGNVFKEQSKRSEKVKPSTSKIDGKMYILNPKEAESVTDSDARSPTISQLKNKDSDKVQGISKSTEDSKYTDDSLTQTGIVKKEEDSFTQSGTTAKQNSNESNLNDSSLSSALLDPRRISFRDESRSPQEEFCDLVTPDVNLLSRSKRKRQFVQGNTEEMKCSKHCSAKSEAEQEGIAMLHPTALHMQFQAELHLLDSFNESLRQVMDVEKCLYNVKQEQEKELPSQHRQSSEQVKSHFSKGVEERNIDDMEHRNEISKLHKHSATEQGFPTHHTTSQTMGNELENLNKIVKPTVKAVEVQTQTVNDMATQTEIRPTRRNVQSRCSEVCGVPYERGFAGDSEIPQLSLDSVEQFEDLDQIEEISLPSKLRTMSEISLHETTSSIRTETGTEISISTRDVTCSFNKYLDLEIAQLIKDEKQRYDKIEMLFKSREKTLNDRTKKLVKLEEQKRALRDTGQESRVSSVKKKQRALLLKLQQEKDEMNRLKELHKIASQERKLMLQKQRNMFNPQMSTKNILTKLKRSADSQSPRRLSGPMKGYDIRSNSSMSSLVDSDKSQHDRSQTDARLQMSESELIFSKSSLDLPKDKFTNFVEGTKPFELLRLDKSDKSDEASKPSIQEKCPYKRDGKSKYEIKSRKFEEKMPKADIRLKSHEPKLMSNHSIPGKYIFEEKSSEQNLDKSEQVKSESDTLVEELSKKSKSSAVQVLQTAFSREIKPVVNSIEILTEEVSSGSQDTVSKTSKSSQVSEDILQTLSKISKRSSKSDKEEKSKKAQYNSESKSNLKRRNSKCQKSKSSSILTENILRSKSEELKHPKRTKTEKEYIQFDKNDENLEKHVREKSFKLLGNRENLDSKENVSCEMFENVEGFQNFNDTKSQISNFAVSHHSSESDRNYSRSVVIRSQNHNLKTSKKLEQILNAREAALTSRKNCVEEWMAWHAKLRTEEDRVARMEQAALKLVTATSNVFSQQDSTVSSDTSDIEGRIELLTEKLAERRIEMSRLKREARKQTKQKLRALEANLLNQIKKYDTTIHEMRKKLELKKTTSKDSKLAIESRSLADFKVPEIPLKKIQDIFKNSDLLRSRSESDLLFSKKASANDSTKKQTRTDTIEAEDDTDHSKKLVNLRISACKNIKSSEADDNSSSLEKLIKPSKNLKSSEAKDNINSLEKHIKLSKNLKSSEAEDSSSNSKKLVSLRISSSKTTKTSEQSIAQSIFDNSISEQIEIDKLGSISPISDDLRSDKIIPYGIKQGKQDSKRNRVSEDVRSEISEDILSQKEIRGEIFVNQTETKSSKRENARRNDISEIRTEISEDILSQTETKTSRREKPKKSSISEDQTEISEDILSQTGIRDDLTEAKSSKRERSKNSSISEEISEDILSQAEVKPSKRERPKKSGISEDRTEISEDTLSQTEIDEDLSETEAKNAKRSISDVRTGISEGVLSQIEVDGDILRTETKRDNVIEDDFQEYKSDFKERTTDFKEYKSDFDTFSEHSPLSPRVSSESTDKIQAPSKSSKASTTSNNLQGSGIIIESRNESLDKKLDFLRLNNQNLNEDISSLENELKILSAMMSRFNKQPDETKLAQNEERSTSKDVSEILSGSDEVQVKDTGLSLNETEISQDSNDRKLKSTLGDNKIVIEQVDMISDMIPNKLPLSRSNSQEIDYKARSKEILNEIEKSIISEHINDSEKIDDNLNSYKENEDSNRKSLSTKMNGKGILNEVEKSISEDINDGSEVINDNLHLDEGNKTDNKSSETDILISSPKLSSKSLRSKTDFTLNSLEKSDLLQIENRSDFQNEDNNLLNSNKNKINEIDRTEGISKEAGVAEYMNELSKQISSKSSSSIRSLEDMKDQSTDDTEGLKANFESILKELQEYKNDTKMQAEDVKDNKEGGNSQSNDRFKYFKKEEDRIQSEEDNKNINNNNLNRSEPFDIQEVTQTEKSDSEDSKLFIDEFKKNTLNKEEKGIKLEGNLINRTFDENDDWDIPNQVVNQFFEKSHDGDSRLFIDEPSRSMNESKNEISDSNTENVSLFIPTFITTDEHSKMLIKLNESVEETEEILNAIAKESVEQPKEEDIEYSIESDDFQKVIHDSVTKILDKVERSIEEGSLIEKFVNRSKPELNHPIFDERRKLFDPTSDEEIKSFSPSIKEKLLEEEDVVTEEISPKSIISEGDLASNKIHSTRAGDENLQYKIEGGSIRERLIDRNKKGSKASIDEGRKLFSPTIQEKSLEDEIIIEEISSTDIEEELASDEIRTAQSNIDGNLQVLDEAEENVKKDFEGEKFVGQSRKKLKTEEERKFSPKESFEKDITIEEISTEEDSASNKIQPYTNVDLQIFDEIEKNEEETVKEKLNRSKTKINQERKSFSPITQEKSIEEELIIEEIASADIEEDLASNKIHTPPNTNVDLQIFDEVEKNEETSLKEKLNQSKTEIKVEKATESLIPTQEFLVTEEISEGDINKIHPTRQLRIEKSPKSQEIIITELEPGNIETESLSELEIDATIELADETTKVESCGRTIKEAKREREKSLEPILELDSSDGEQLDNLIEVAESRLAVIEKTKNSPDFNESLSESLSHDKTETDKASLSLIDEVKSKDPLIDKTFDIIKDPEYEDISEESLEVSEIFDKCESQRTQKASLIERYEAIQKSEEVLKILDEITQRSVEKSENRNGDNEEDISRRSDRSTPENFENEKTVTPENQSVQVGLNEFDERQDALSESSEGRDTPRGVSEIELDSPRELNDSRLDIELLNDDLLSNGDKKDTYRATPIVTTEKDIEVMIDKLKASLEQPRVEDADWAAKLLRIEQLQIELEIKKLEAEEVSYYVREIPNKPPPPYTPPGGGTRISTSLGSPSPPPAVIPSNTEELTAFTEKATAIIFRAKEAGEDIMTLEAPSEICELTKENDETVKKDRRIYNAFLFDLCKETIAEVYQAVYEKPGPSWTKPNVKTKPTMKIPKTIDELNAYVNKEVATLFGFKTKLQRENMVTRWSRKRRDRVDELLAREAQAEEDEWTKFHHDELAVKNGLTVTILDTLLMETVNVVKVAYAKKRKILV